MGDHQSSCEMLCLIILDCSVGGRWRLLTLSHTLGWYPAPILVALTESLVRAKQIETSITLVHNFGSKQAALGQIVSISDLCQLGTAQVWLDTGHATEDIAKTLFSRILARDILLASSRTLTPNLERLHTVARTLYIALIGSLGR